MTADPNIRVIEIEGVKVEVDLRTAKQVNSYKVGDRVKLLLKTYSGHEVKPGVIVGIDAFKKLPTIVIAYIPEILGYGATTGKISFAHLNAESKDVEICPLSEEDILPNRETVVAYFDRAIEEKQKQIEDVERRREYFLRQYGTTFAVAAEDLQAATQAKTDTDNPF